MADGSVESGDVSGLSEVASAGTIFALSLCFCNSTCVLLSLQLITL